jgi:hypothetical protein
MTLKDIPAGSRCRCRAGESYSTYRLRSSETVLVLLAGSCLFYSEDFVISLSAHKDSSRVARGSLFSHFGLLRLVLRETKELRHFLPFSSLSQRISSNASDLKWQESTLISMVNAAGSDGGRPGNVHTGTRSPRAFDPMKTESQP